MAVRKHTPLDYGALNLGSAQFSIFVCDTTAELPNGTAPMQFRKGDIAIANDTQGFYVASSSTTWKRIDGAALTPAATVVSGTGFALSPAVGSSLNYAREDHGHGSVGHDSHTLLGGITADQHHLEVHGSGKHTGGIVAVQDEGVAAGLAATVNFVGAGVDATLAGTVATVTIPGGGISPETRYAAKLTDSAAMTTTTLIADTDLQLNALPANSQWEFSARLQYSSGAGGMDITFALITGATAKFGQQGAWAGGFALSGLGAGGRIALAGTGAGEYAAHIRGFVYMGSSAGDLALQRSLTSTSGSSVLRKGSALSAVRQA